MSRFRVAPVPGGDLVVDVLWSGTVAPRSTGGRSVGALRATPAGGDNLARYGEGSRPRTGRQCARGSSQEGGLRDAAGRRPGRRARWPHRGGDLLSFAPYFPAVLLVALVCGVAAFLAVKLGNARKGARSVSAALSEKRDLDERRA